MKRKTLMIAAFILVALAQLFVPIQMISKQADFAISGNEFLFRIRHNRPDAFQRGNTGSTLRGKYIWLQFEQNKFKIADRKNWEPGQTVYVTFESDSLGCARIQNVAKTKPGTGSDWVKARAFLNNRDTSMLYLTYPFNNYYIEDNNTQDIDSAYSKKLKDSLSNICLKVNIKENQFIVNDLVVDSLSFKEFVKQVRDKRSN